MRVPAEDRKHMRECIPSDPAQKWDCSNFHWQGVQDCLDDLDDLETQVSRFKFEIGQFLQAYDSRFFQEPEGFSPKLDMNSAAMVRHVLKKILELSAK